MITVPVSVVIPTFNSGHLVTQAVESVLTQSVSAAQIIVVDDGSVDDTDHRLACYRDRIAYIHQVNQGVSAARNRGIFASREEYVAFLDADDVWHPQKLERQMRVLSQWPELSVLGTQCFDWPAAQFDELGDVSVNPVSIVRWDKQVIANRLSTSSNLIRRTVFDRVGYFDTDLQGPEDHDLFTRIAEVYLTANLELPLTGYRNVPASLSKQAERMELGMRQILKKLDERNAWGNRWLLRRKAQSYVDHSCAYMYGAAGCYGRAMLRSIRSLVRYPLPYARDEVQTSMERPKRLAMLASRALGQSRSIPDRQMSPVGQPMGFPKPVA